MYILHTYFSNYNNWVITTNSEPTPKPNSTPYSYLVLQYFLKYTVSTRTLI